MKKHVEHHIESSLGRKVYLVINMAVLVVMSFLCLMPVLNVLSLSLSSSAAANSSRVTFWPVEFNLNSYQYILDNTRFGDAFWMSIKRVVIGLPVNTILTVLTAYPLSKNRKALPGRTIFTWIFFFAMMVGTSLVPLYITMRNYQLLDSIWALILPGALPISNMLLVMNCFRSLPKEIEESAFVDGASHWVSLLKICLPLSLPSLATVSLFTIVGHWNSWFDGMIMMNHTENYPLQTYLQTITVNYETSQLATMTAEQLEAISNISNRTTQAAMIFIAALPVMCVYPFLQKYFVKGIVLGSVKG